MNLSSFLENIFMLSIDTLFSLIPRRIPDSKSFKQCKLVSHRGDHDGNKTIIENTMAAFDRVLDNHIWGVEFDIRWTRDLIPLVYHDEDLMRLFGSPLKVRNLTFDELRKDFPLIPTLEEVINKYGESLHMFAEIKAERYPDPVFQNKRLKSLFAGLEPVTDYHVLSLSPDMFTVIDFAPEYSFVPVAETNIREMSNFALEHNLGGICGHYLMLTDEIAKKHHSKGQQTGTGYTASANCLFNEINRGTDWIFSNNAVKVQKIIDRYSKHELADDSDNRPGHTGGKGTGKYGP
jgi:glycerophosphoryl diester phosphodiesterase